MHELNALCFKPVTTENPKTNEEILVPCGKCHICIRKRISAWTFRLKEEYKNSDRAYFVTLTLNNDNLDRTPNGFATLSKERIQKYFKRLRKYYKSGYIKYFLAGEYGAKRMRPHYHAIIFNAKEKHITRAWGLNFESFGDVQCDEVNIKTIQYCLKYIDKPKQIPIHGRDDRLKEFHVMSNGLGKSYAEDKRNLKFHHDNLIEHYFAAVERNVKTAIPRYLKELIYTAEEREFIGRMFKKIADKNLSNKSLVEIKEWSIFEVNKKEKHKLLKRKEQL